MIQRALRGISALEIFETLGEVESQCRLKKAEVRFNGDTVFLKIGDIDGQGADLKEAINDRYRKLAEIVEEEALKNFETLPRPYLVKIIKGLWAELTEEEKRS